MRDKNQQEASERKEHGMCFQQVVGSWKKGALTTQHAVGDLLCELTNETYDEFCQQIPGELMSTLKKRVDESPMTQEEWELMRFYRTGAYASFGRMGEIIKAREERDRQYISNFRRGVEVVRSKEYVRNSS
jgi:hypothetical protein